MILLEVRRGTEIFYRKVGSAAWLSQPPLRRGWLESTSFVVLLFVAMPLKYLAGLPLAVRIVGSVHGLLFLIFLAALHRAGVFKRAVAAGAKAEMPPADLVWGARMGNIVDPFGHKWAIATHKEDISPAEMEKRMAAMGS